MMNEEHGSQTLPQKLINFTLGHRTSVLVFLLLITVIAGIFAARVEYDNTLETYFLDGDLDEYNLFLDQFGTDEFIVLVFGNEDIFTIDNLRLIDSISKRIETFDHVRRIYSLTDVNTITGTEGTASFSQLIDKFPETAEELQEIKNRALRDSFIPGTIISKDARYTAVVAEIEHIVGEFDYKMELLEQFRAYKEELERSTGKTFSIGGSPVLDDAFFRYNKRDQQTVIPIMILVICLLAWVMFRNVTHVVLMLFVVMLAVIWTYGFLVFLGLRINAVATIIPLILMGSGVAGFMHFISAYTEDIYDTQSDTVRSIKNAFGLVIKPTFLTSLTTMFGLLSLLVADLGPIKELGIVSAFGVLSIFIITVLLTPIVLSYLPVPPAKYHGKVKSGLIAKYVSRLSQWKRGRSILALSAVGIFVLPAIASLSGLNVGTNSLDYYRKDDPVRSQVEWIDSHLGGTHSLEFFVQTDEEHMFQNPDFLRKVDRFQEYLKQYDGITKVYSLVDMVKTLNKSFHSEDTLGYAIPSSQNEIAQQLLVLEGTSEMEALTSGDYSRGRIIARVAMDMSQQIGHHIPDIKKTAGEIFGPGTKVIPTGIVYLMNSVETYLLSSQIKSFLLAFLVITITILFMLRSIKLGLLAMIPNLLPIFFSMALMPVLGISLDVGTVMVAAIALGLVVDDTIHFLSAFNDELRNVQDHKLAIKKAIERVGRPIIYTSIVLGLGFSILLFASFNPLVHFGILASIVVSIALWFDLIFLPGLLGFMGRRIRKPNTTPQSTGENLK